MTVRPEPPPHRAWTATQDVLRRINYLAVMLVLPPTMLWNAARLDLPAERALLALAGIGPLLAILIQVLVTRTTTPDRRAEPVTDVLLLAQPALTALIHWRFGEAALASGALIPALLFPGYAMRWNVLYRDQPARRMGLSAAYVLLSVAAVAASYARGHVDIDPLTVLLLGGLQLIHFADFQRVARQVDTEREGRDAAEHTARHDPLTGLLNRRAFDTDTAALDPTRRHSLIVLDIDHFKRVNDDHGHDVGDLVLCGLATRLHALVQYHGHAYRWGGEEFAVLLPDTPGVQAAEIAETIRRRVEQQPIADLSITVSLGTGEWHPDLSARENFTRVDTALMRAKAHGRNRVGHAGTPPIPAHVH